MNFNTHHSTSLSVLMVKALILGVFILILALPAVGQDRPVNNKSKLREARFKSRSNQGDRPRTKDLAGRRVRTKNQSSAGRASSNVYPAPKTSRASGRAQGKDKAGRPVSRIHSFKPRDPKPWQGGYYGKRVSARRSPENARNIFSNRAELSRLKRQQRDPNEVGGGKRFKPLPSASKSYISRKSVNPMARFHRKLRQGEKAFLTDPSGKRLWRKNFETPRPKIIVPPDPYRGRRPGDDRAYKARRGNQPQSATKKTPSGWSGDLAGRKLRRLNFSSRVRTGANLPALSSPKPRFGDDQQGRAKRKISTATQPAERRTGKSPLPPKTPVERKAGGFSGNIKARKSVKGAGGTVSGGLHNNEGYPLNPRLPSDKTAKASQFKGNVKARRPDKGGGSVSGKLWNNKETPIVVRPPSSETRKAGLFQGNVKARRPDKGGGSVSGKLWNNKETPIAVRPPSSDTRKAGLFQGNIKARRPEKGGGSVSGELRNNDGMPLDPRLPSDETAKASRYKGTIQLSRFKRNYIKNPNSADEALKKAKPSKYNDLTDGLQVKVKQYRYIRNSSSADEALKVREPGRAFGAASDYQGNIRMKKFDLFSKNALHPDSKFVKTNRNNVREERDAVTNFKLWWSRMFKKNETQPSHLKEKIGKPRYDKNEQGLWHD